MHKFKMLKCPWNFKTWTHSCHPFHANDSQDEHKEESDGADQADVVDAVLSRSKDSIKILAVFNRHIEQGVTEANQIGRH